MSSGQRAPTRDEYVPDRGHVVWVDFDPQAGHEQAGHRPALVLSSKEFNKKMGVAFVCPITNKPKGIPFEVPVPAGADVTGVILCQHAKSLDWRARRCAFKCQLDPETVNSVTGRILPIIDPDGIFSLDEG